MNDADDLVAIALERIRSALDSHRDANAVSLLLDLHPADRAELYRLLDEDDREKLFSNLNIQDTADLLEELEDEDVLEAVEELSPAELADVLDEMEPDEAADLLGDLPAEQRTELLAQMEDLDEVLPLLGYPDETAGGLMTTWYIALRRHTTAEQAIQFLRQVSPETEVPYYLYVVDREKRLVGVVGLRELVVASADTTMEAIMDPDVIFVSPGADQEEVARVMTRYDLANLPVVDDQHRLIGIITHDDLVDIIEDEATEDIYRLANLSDTDLEPASPVATQLRVRLPWLFLNTLTALFASWVVTHFESLIAEVAILAAFQSVIAGLGGNSATQNVVMIVRSISLGRMDQRKPWWVMTRQAWVGLLQGVFIGLAVGIGVAFWQGNLALGIVLFMAMIANLIVAGIIGTIVPLSLMAMRKDPAVASSVLVTAATDSFGFFIFLSLAARFLPYLQ